LSYKPTSKQSIRRHQRMKKRSFSRSQCFRCSVRRQWDTGRYHQRLHTVPYHITCSWNTFPKRYARLLRADLEQFTIGCDSVFFWF